MPFLTEDAKITIVSTTTAGAAGQTAITSTALDMSGYDGCLFIIPLGTIADTAVTSVKLQQCDTTGGSYADLAGSSQTIADTDDNKLVYIDICRPQEKFLKVVVTRGTADATIGGIIAMQYNRGFTLPSGFTHGTGVSGECGCSPAEGTA